jgi:helicase
MHIGIDHYADPELQWLTGAVRDAEALHALFADNFGIISSALLTDKAATASAIRAALSTLAEEADADDIVVITYAGHGSEDHYLIPYDGAIRCIPDTCISLSELADLLSVVPGSTLLCALDCCFSGGLGARVFSTGLRPRAASLASGIGVLDRFTGNGRVVLTASAEDQPAMESARHGHGLMTFRLIEALQGAAEVRQRDRVDLYQVIRYVTRQVEADAAQMGHRQTPTLRGRLDGAPLWPVLTPGALYAERFPDRVRQPATADLGSLEGFGIPASIRASWAGSIQSLNGLQLAAINEYGVLDGENVVVTAPTSSGKTMIGELAALQKTQNRQRAIFLLPMRALVNDKYEQFTRLYQTAGIRVIRATGEHSDQVPELLRGQFDIGLLTYEKFTALALGAPHVLDLAATIVVDEAQMLADRSRGSNLEFMLTLLNQRRGSTGNPQIITLSAVVGDTRGLDRWLGGRHLSWKQRPVPLVEGVIDDAGGYRFRDELGAEHVTPAFIRPLYASGSRRLLIPLVRRLLSEDKKVVIFRESRPESAACAVYLSRELGLAPFSQIADLDTGEMSVSSRTLREVMLGGVAFHNSDLSRDERRVIEEGFRDPYSALRVIVATPTLAMGVNTPAAAVAIVGLTHPGPVPTAYSVAEYKNMAGRAGRLGFTDRGESYLIPSAGLDPGRAWHQYVNGPLESLDSQLVPDGDPRTLMLRALASHPADATGAITEDEVVGFLDASLAAFQARERGQAQWDRDRLRASFHQLAAVGLITAEGDGFRLTELGRFTGESGVHVDSIIRLVRGIGAAAGQLNSVALVAAAQLTNELNEIYLRVNARAKNTEVPRWPRLLASQGVPFGLLHEMQATAVDGKQATARAKRAAAAAMWIAGLPMEQIETQLNQHLRNRGGLAGTVRSIADRTRDLMPAVAAVVRALHPSQPVDDLAERTMLRLELGLPAEMVELASLVTTQLTRPQWLKLHAAGLFTVTAVQEAQTAQLAQLLGADTTASALQDELRDLPANTTVSLPELPQPTE